MVKSWNYSAHENKIDYALPSCSLICMEQEVQGLWQHAIPKSGAGAGEFDV